MKFTVSYIGHNGALIEETFDDIIRARCFAIAHRFSFYKLKANGITIYDNITEEVSEGGYLFYRLSTRA